MAYSFDFGAQVTRICMNEIRRRGLDERKILRKSAPNSILLLKVFRQQNCTADDLIPVSIHSVATLMQDTLWCCQERIVPKKVWRIINYETCTLPDLSKVLTKKGEALLIEILDFLVELMQHKANNLMDAYHLGEAMGKVTLGPADCDPIIAEKAGHFMTRMIIEHSKWLTQNKRPPLDRQLSPYQRYSAPVILSPTNSPKTSPDISNGNQDDSLLQPMSKAEAAKAKAKSYNRLIQRIKKCNEDWVDYANVGLRAMIDDDYELVPVPKDEPWISIFAPELDPKDANTSPLLYRIMSQATKVEPPVPSDPFASSYWFQHRHSHPLLQTNQKGGPAFSEFAPLIQSNTQLQNYNKNNASAPSVQWQEKEKSAKSHLQKINHSLSNMKINLRKRSTFPSMDEGSGFSTSENTTIRDDYTINENDSAIQHHSSLQQSSLQKRQQEKEQRSNEPSSQQQITESETKLTEQDSKQQEQPSSPRSYQTQQRSPSLPDDNSTREVSSLATVSKHNQVKNIMRRVIKIGNTNSGSSSIKKNYAHIVY
ncbi:uncharacterized protein BX664DRAFT_327399 [Halteromyces radiatus]|uniref:uncharacterized protein n=1 Tax=Halteromyces radiatus TaxID=101107 RepID=UPI002220450C|nr:uncharacterized protein BX664DRAFT_327399 [Halteromyces radiatus]KAI8092486.1 hypothetical protein BX664DRAFT_327399 [Halteromyces radiatus]